MAIEAANPQERVEQLIVLTQRLSALMTREADAFEAHRPHDVVAGAEETARLANLYRHESLRIRKDPGLIEAAPPPLRKKLIEATRTFDTALARHGRAVMAAKTVTEGLVRAIAEEVVAQQAHTVSYGAGGRSGEGNTTSITLNQRA